MKILCFICLVLIMFDIVKKMGGFCMFCKLGKCVEIEVVKVVRRRECEFDNMDLF